MVNVNGIRKVEVYTGKKERNGVWEKKMHVCTIYFNEDLVSDFWKNLSGTRGEYILDGSLVDILTEEQNMRWGDGIKTPCIKYMVSNGSYIKTMILPTKSMILIKDEAKELILKQKRNPNDKLITRNIIHYILRVMSVTQNRVLSSSTYKQSFVFPKEAFKTGFSSLFSFQTIPGADIRSTELAYIVSMPMEEARKFCGYFLTNKPKNMITKNVLYGETFFNPKYITLKEN